MRSVIARPTAAPRKSGLLRRNTRPAGTRVFRVLFGNSIQLRGKIRAAESRSGISPGDQNMPLPCSSFLLSSIETGQQLEAPASKLALSL
jgi:hypothetical protein